MSGKKSSKDMSTRKGHLPVTRNSSKRIVRTKTSFKETKHTLKKPQVAAKSSGRARKRQKIDKSSSKEDLLANKENNMPTPISKKGKNSKNGSNLRKRNIKNSYEKSIKEETSDADTQGKQSTKRISLKKKTVPESASKLSVAESNKENSE